MLRLNERLLLQDQLIQANAYDLRTDLRMLSLLLSCLRQYIVARVQLHMMDDVTAQAVLKRQKNNWYGGAAEKSIVVR